MDTFDTNPHMSRLDLEQAAQRYFDRLRCEVDQPVGFDDYEFSDGVDFSIEESKRRIADLDDQLRAKDFDPVVRSQAEHLLVHLEPRNAQLSDRERELANELAARAEREKLFFLAHRLTSPAKRYDPYDALFAQRSADTLGSSLGAVAPAGPTLTRLSHSYVEAKRRLGRSKNQVEDTVRVLRWLSESIDGERPAATITKAELRGFRDDLIRLPKDGRGQGGPFAQRLTDNIERQVTGQTAQRYWGFVLAFFAWAASEGFLQANPAGDLRMQTVRDTHRRSPESFSQDEVASLLRSPLYQGHARGRWTTPGSYRTRDGRWWSGLLFMHTGMRAGELAQLESEDFVFDHQIPHVYVRLEGRDGKNAKQLKNVSSARRIPLAQNLLELGLEAFVHSRKKRHRVFDEFVFGGGRKSDGLSKFWQRYLLGVGLWKEGRATHVWRHTLVANLRLAGVDDQDIAAVVGHVGTTITSKYGGEYPLERKLETIRRLDFGFDITAILSK